MVTIMRALASYGLTSLAFVMFGCSPTVGTACNNALAQTLVYDQGGNPAYAGQSMLITSCASGGSFCHADLAQNRYGAPFGMNFDPTLADAPRWGRDEGMGADHLYRAQLLSHHLRDDIFSQVAGGQMPPGNVGAAVLRPPYIQYADSADAIGTPLPDIRSAEGREILRNWLACGSPVVESTTPPSATPCMAESDCTLPHTCDVDRGECSLFGAVEPTRVLTTADWPSIYATIVQPSCALAVCHGADGAALSGDLDLSTEAIAYGALVGVAASTAVCGTRIVASEPDASYFIAKLEGTQNIGNCGDRMPIGSNFLSTAQIALIRAWITDGARPTP